MHILNLERVFIGMIWGAESKFGLVFRPMCILLELWPFLFGKFNCVKCLFKFSKNTLAIQWKLENWYKCSSGVPSHTGNIQKSEK